MTAILNKWQENAQQKIAKCTRMNLISIKEITWKYVIQFEIDLGHKFSSNDVPLSITDRLSIKTTVSTAPLHWSKPTIYQLFWISGERNNTSLIRRNTNTNIQLTDKHSHFAYLRISFARRNAMWKMNKRKEGRNRELERESDWEEEWLKSYEAHQDNFHLWRQCIWIVLLGRNSAFTYTYTYIQPCMLQCF